MERNIAVGIDGTDTGWAALAWAVEEAETSAARLTICQAGPRRVISGRNPATATVELLDPVLARHLHATRDRLGGHRVDLELPCTGAVDALLDLAGRADLLVVGAPTDADPAHLSIGARVGAHTPVPVIVVRPVPPQHRGPFAGHVVVGVDGSEASRAALRFGFRYAQRHRIPLAAVHASDEPAGDFWFDDTMLETHFSTEPGPVALLAAAVEPIMVDFPAVPVKRAACHGKAAPALRRAAAGAYLLVVGRHGHRLPSMLRLGSVSQALAADAGCVVAIVP